MHIVKQLFLSLFIFCLLSIVLPGSSPRSTFAQEPDQVAELMARMSVEDKVGQLFIVPFVGAEANPGTDIWQLITEYKVGGVILLAANSNFNNDESAPRQIAELTNTLKTTAFQINGVPLFVAIDHEGDGYPYTRITRGVTPVPSQMAIGATWDTAKAEAIGQIVGEELATMGVNLLLGPSVDVLNDPRPTGRGDIGIRVFGGDPYWVGQMGRAYIRGVHLGSNGKIATVAKHFPGHGGSDRLPDNEVATVDKSLQELQRIELPPFYEVTAAKTEDEPGMTDALMSSHIRYRGFQGDIRQFTAPISFDAAGMTTLLNLPEIAAWRDNGGLIVSDALGVPAVRKHFDPTLESFPHRRIAKEAFLAGNDVLSLVQFDLKSIWSDQFANIKDTIFFFRSEYTNNPAFAEQVDKAVARILRLKLKLYPDLTLDALNNDPARALEVAGQPRPVVTDIARQSLTLLYPSPEELQQRLPQPPRSDENILIITDTRMARECYADNCQPREDLFLPRRAIEETILRLYGPGATGQIQPERISSITYSELKMFMGGAITPPPELSEELPISPEIQLSAEEVRQRIQEANWLIFATLDLNTSRYSDSDALKLFLTQGSGILLDKTSVVFAFNAPYYLDTTEITKLTAYYGLYSKTAPYLETAVRAFFGEADFPGASPVSVEGIGYELVNVLSPDPNQELVIEPVEILPEERIVPVSVQFRTGPVFDQNGNPVPDGTPIEFRAMLGERQVAAETAHTQAGMAEAALTLTEPGDLDILAAAGPNLVSESLQVSVFGAPATPTVLAAASPAAPPTVTPSPTPRPSPTPLPTSTTPPLPPKADTPASPPEISAMGSRQLDGWDLLLALGAILLAGLVGLWLGRLLPKPLPRRIRLGLWILIGGLSAYLLYGTGLLRPEQWLFERPSLLASRLSMAGMVFLFGLLALGLSNQNDRRRHVRLDTN